jgi:hypothetical protein
MYRMQVVQNMSTWATNTQENWVSYHITREQMGDPNLNGHDKAQVLLVPNISACSVVKFHIGIFRMLFLYNLTGCTGK